MILTFLALSAKAQFVDCTTGLLNCPSAEMNESGTFTMTSNFLNKHILAGKMTTGAYSGWDYNTIGYGLDITFWSRLEVAYCCVIFNNRWSPSYDQMGYRARILLNQDRHFAAKVQLLKEGEFGRSWIPALAVGVSDPISGSKGDYKDASIAGSGYFNRYYVALTKHFQTKLGEITGTVGYQYNRDVSKYIHYNSLCAAVTWRPVWLENRWFDPKFIFEYDARLPNIGLIADIWDDSFEAMFCLHNFQWVSFGLRFKLRLKGAK